MKVKELIKALNDFDKESEVCLYTPEQALDVTHLDLFDIYTKDGRQVVFILTEEEISVYEEDKRSKQDSENGQ